MQALSERNAVVTRGPKFWRDDAGIVQFQFVIDHGNVVGPRPAKLTDQAQHDHAWTEFVLAEAAADQADAEPEVQPAEQVPGQPEGDAPRRKTLRLKSAD